MLPSKMHMSEEDAEQLAFDVACGYFNDEQLCRRFDLTVAQLKQIRVQDAFLAMVEENERLLKDDGSEFLIQAKGYAKNALQSLDKLARRGKSEEVRRKAACSVLEYARIPTADPKAQAGSGNTIIINTNLGLDQDPKGTYVVQAKPGALPKAQRVEEDDFSDLL